MTFRMSKSMVTAKAQQFAAANPKYGTAEGCGGNEKELEIALEFLMFIGAPEEEWVDLTDTGKRRDLDSKDINTLRPYHLVKIGKTMIDFAARQFSPTAPYPTIWEVD